MNKKRTIILFLLIPLIAVIAFVTTYINNKNAKQQNRGPAAPTILVDPPPRIIEVPEIPEGAIFIYSGPDKPIPPSLPVYGYTESLSGAALLSLGNKISSSFGLISSPSALIDGDYFAYTRNDEYKSFSLSNTKNVVNVTYQRILVEDTSLFVQTDGQSLPSFFLPLLSLSGDAMIYPIQMDKTVFDGVVLLETPTPDVTNFGFGISLNNHPLLTRENTKRWASALIDNRGAVRILNYIPAPTVTRRQDVPIVPLNEAVANINAARGDILWITQTTGEEYGVTPSFAEGVLNDFSLVYVYQNNRLAPAYLFNGSGKAQTGDTQIFEVLVLAVPSSL
jgi:hypothetical protein